MKQMKNKSQKSAKKQPINVRLSKDDLKELLVILKNVITEDIGMRLLDTNHRVEMLQRRVTDINKTQRSQESKKGVLHCAHEDKLDHITYGQISGTFLTVAYKCVWCKRVDNKMFYRLTWKEKRALRNLGVKT